MPASGQLAAIFRPLLEECGYSGERLETAFPIGRGKTAVVGFASSERDMDSACIAVVAGGGDPVKAVQDCRELAAPVVWVHSAESTEWWIQRAGDPERFKPDYKGNFNDLVLEHKHKLDPITIYQGRTLARINTAKQLDFVDAGLLPLRREEAGEKLHATVESMIAATLKAAHSRNPSKSQLRDIFTSIFRMLAGKILKDKGIGEFVELDFRKPKVVLDAVAAHYDTTGRQPTKPASGYAALKHAASILAETGSFSVVSPESLAYVYEQTLVTKDLRKKLGIHATPPWLVDYMVWQLYDWIQEIPIKDRHVFEPACGHAPFLLSMMRLLRMDLYGKRDRAIHEYLKKHIHGAEMDDFAREIARLSLTLADIPNPNGWDIRPGDMFASDILMRQSELCRILLCNPPYEKFSPTDKSHCAKAGFPVAAKKAVELIKRTVDKLPAGGVFGLIVPQTVISGPEAKQIREFLLRNCEIAEVCRFPGKVFKFAQIETAIILGRRAPAGIDSHDNRVRIRTVGEQGIKAFQYNFTVDEDTIATQRQLLDHPEFELKVPALNELWIYLRNNPRVRDFAIVGRGIEYKGENARQGKPVVSDTQSSGFSLGFAGVSRSQAVYTPPPLCWLSTNTNLIGNPRQGRAVGYPQVLVNMGRSSRYRWRIKPLLDPQGLNVKNNFAIIRPKENKMDAMFLWAVLNSPIANAFVSARTMRKHNYEGILSDIPLPAISQDSMYEIIAAARNYRAIAQSRDTKFLGMGKAAITHEHLFSEQPAPKLASSESDVLAALLHLDAMVLRAYALPVRLERQLLDYFNGSVRKGVGCSFGNYFPESFCSYVPLHKFVSTDYQTSTIDRLSARIKANASSVEAVSLRTAADAFGGDD